MTNEQTKYILDQYGYAENQIIKFPEISSIITDFNSTQYPGDSTRFKFLTGDNSLLLVYYGKENRDGEFEYSRIENGEPKPNFYIPLSVVYAIRVVNRYNQAEPYKYNKAV